MPPTSAPFPVVREGPPSGSGGGGKMCSGAWKRGPQSPVGVISLCCSETEIKIQMISSRKLYEKMCSGFTLLNAIYPVCWYAPTGEAEPTKHTSH